MGISFLFSFAFLSLLFSAICKVSSDSHFAFLHFFFLEMVLITASCTMSWTPIHGSSGTLLLKNCCFWTVVLEKTLESPLDCKEIQPVYPKGNQSWIFIGMTDAEAETPILWPSDAKNWFIGKDLDAGKDRRQEEKGTDRGWDGRMVSLSWWTGVWVSSRSWWWTGKPGMLQSMGSQRVRHDWATELTFF